MANLIIKPTSGGSLVLQDEGGDAAVTVGTTGSTTLAGTANNLGTVVSGNLSSQDIVMPRVKEVKRFYYSTKTADTSAIVTDLNISSTNYCGPFTPEHNDDIFIMNWTFNVWMNSGYMGWGVSMDDNTSFSSPSHIHRKGQHAHGSSASGTINGITDVMHYQNADGNFHCTASQISATVGTAWYFRMIGMTHNSTTNCTWGEESTNHVNSQGIAMIVQRWSAV